MRLKVDTSPVKFMVSKLPEEKKDQDGRQRADRQTGELLYTVELFARDESGGSVIKVTVAGQPPKVSLDQLVTPVELEAIPWAQNGRSGIAYRAKAINGLSGTKAA